MKCSKVILVVLCTLAALAALWIVGLLLKIGALLLWILSIPFVLLSKLLLTQPILFTLLVAGGVCWWLCRKNRRSVPRGSGDRWHRDVAELDYRLDRLNDMLSRRF